MEKINTNSVRLYNDIRSLIIGYDLPAINISLILEKISAEMEHIVENEVKKEREAEQFNTSNGESEVTSSNTPAAQ